MIWWGELKAKYIRKNWAKQRKFGTWSSKHEAATHQFSVIWCHDCHEFLVSLMILLWIMSMRLATPLTIIACDVRSSCLSGFYLSGFLMRLETNPFGQINQWYPLLISHSHGKSPFLIGKPSINGHFPWLCKITRGYPLRITKLKKSRDPSPSLTSSPVA